MRAYVLALSLLSFTATAQNKIEADFDKHLSAENIGNRIKDLSAKPHYVSSVGSKEVADKLLAQFKSYGWEAEIETYHVLFPYPKARVLEMTSPKKFSALLKEPALKEDGTSGQADQLPTYNAWSADGDVSGELVYVNFGLPEDYEVLESMGISVKGKIVIARYGRSWRGIKPKIAQEHGAIGCIIYSDPLEDGYTQGDVYPVGPFKNEHGVQRGSVMDMVVYPGDPLTPGIGATKEAKRIDRLEAENLLKIPVLPISYHDAKPLLAALGGPVAPDGWRGALPFTYHVGPGATKVRLKMESDWKIVPAYNVIAKIRGSEFPDQWIIRGNHHDAWVNGASDPVSGVASMMEEAKAIGELVKAGYRPKRTLVFAAWDAEEPALLGSTEWAEHHKEELQRKAVVYINTDGSGRGFLSAGGSHALETLMDGIAKDVKDPQTQVSVYDRLRAANIANASTTAGRKTQMGRKNLSLGALGSGSDYTVFLQHLGIPSLNLGYGGEHNGGSYHSIYDSYDHYSRFGDPGFQYGVTLAQTIGRAVLRLADAEVLPFDFKSLHKTVSGYVSDLVSQTDQMREATLLKNEAIKSNYFQLAADPLLKRKMPEPQDEVPYIDFAPLHNALRKLELATESFNSRISAAKTPAEKQKLNERIYRSEQQLLSGSGLPRRPWFQHTLYAPGFYTGYGVKTMPGVREAIEQRNWKEAEAQIKVNAQALERLADYLSQ